MCITHLTQIMYLILVINCILLSIFFIATLIARNARFEYLKVFITFCFEFCYIGRRKIFRSRVGKVIVIGVNWKERSLAKIV